MQVYNISLGLVNGRVKQCLPNFRSFSNSLGITCCQTLKDLFEELLTHFSKTLNSKVLYYIIFKMLYSNQSIELEGIQQQHF